MAYSKGKGRAGQTKSTGCYHGTAGGMKGVKIGGGTTFPASKASKIMSGGMGKKTGGKFKQSGHPMKGTNGKGY